MIDSKIIKEIFDQEIALFLKEHREEIIKRVHKKIRKMKNEKLPVVP